MTLTCSANQIAGMVKVCSHYPEISSSAIGPYFSRPTRGVVADYYIKNIRGPKGETKEGKGGQSRLKKIPRDKGSKEGQSVAN